ncbi:MAG TPA: type ISP restriction/modification enzyme, partial [Thermoanaerobaculia bacterium]|nr:type ISP restriction/modification enzyme [Thermoanaerobaculia bacterium]
AAAPVPELLRRAYHESNGRDPVLHFYETFLARYDQALRKRRGVYYTPLPVVTYMVRSVHRLLETRLGLPGGLANPAVTLLDPAAGTLTFLVEAFRVAIESYRAEAGEGGLAQLVRDHLLPHFHGFELMMAPYVIGHLKMSLMLAEWGFPLADGQRVQLYLTDALEPEPLAQSSLPGIESLSRESHAAGQIKTEQPISVVLGNPPYSGKSANSGTWIRDLIVDGYRRPDGSRDEGYHRVDGAPLGERNPKWLQDDYVKFLRFAEWKIEQNGQGVAALVTNHGYLENPTFRGLRRSLMKTFDEIYLLDLGGSRFEREGASELDGASKRDGEPDENVFPEVSRGVVIALLVKLPPGKSTRVCRVYTAALRGRRAGKARRLLEEDVETTAWSEITPQASSYRFRTGDAALEEEYGRGAPLDRLFPLHSAGVVTARDQLALAFDHQELIDQLNLFRATLRDSTPRSFGARDTATWRLDTARRAAREDTLWRDKLTTLLYRPFDRRHLLYADYLIERPRRRVMRHLLGTGTPALIAPRQCKEPFGALVTTGLAGHKAVSAADINSVFPLYLEPEGLFAQPEGLFGHREPNLAPGLLDQLAALHGALPTPEEVLAYVYAVLYSPAYRGRYAGPLKRGFARVPFARNPAVFWQLARLGQELIDLHLERSPRLWPNLVRFCGAGDGTLGSERQLRAYRPAERRVVVNAAGQAFEGISPEVWEYRIGGTRVLPRWLAARAKRRLTLGEIDAFRRAATALHHTLELEKQLDGPALEAIRDPAVLDLPKPRPNQGSRRITTLARVFVPGGTQARAIT